MSIIKTALVAASFVVVAAAANAQGREDLNSRFHGEAATEQSYSVAPRAAYIQNARGAYAQAYTNRIQPQVQQHDANPLIDNFHGND